MEKLTRIKRKSGDTGKSDKSLGRHGTSRVSEREELRESVGKMKRRFEDVGVSSWLCAALRRMEIQQPTAIQAACIPEILMGKNCVGGSRTGSGKTLTFAVPVLQKWSEDPHVIFCVVLTPARELAAQIYEQFLAVASGQDVRICLITGGGDLRDQGLELSRQPHIVVATPGRLAEHVDNSTGNDTLLAGLRRVHFLVLDEADRLLAPTKSGSLLSDVNTCLNALPGADQRQTLLFTATLTNSIRDLATSSAPTNKASRPTYVYDPDGHDKVLPDSLEQYYQLVTITHRECYLHVLLSTPINVNRSVIVFCNRTRTATLLEHILRTLNYRVTALHSGLRQKQRLDNLVHFRAGRARVLIATDVAARGLDIPNVEMVLNYDVPRDPHDYIHRVGRTARAGRIGQSVTLVGQRDVDLIFAIEQRVKRKLTEYREDRVNIDDEVIQRALKPVTTAKREVLLNIEQGFDVTGRRKRMVR